MSLQGKTAVVTGGTRGIGKAVALRLAQDGANIGILHRQEATSSDAIAQIRERGSHVLALQCDVSDYGRTKAAVASIHEEFGSIDMLINNAGVDIAGLFVHTDEALWDTIINTNYKGFLITTHVCIPYMIE